MKRFVLSDVCQVENMNQSTRNLERISQFHALTKFPELRWSHPNVLFDTPVSSTNKAINFDNSNFQQIRQPNKTVKYSTVEHVTKFLINNYRRVAFPQLINGPCWEFLIIDRQNPNKNWLTNVPTNRRHRGMANMCESIFFVVVTKCGTYECEFIWPTLSAVAKHTKIQQE